MNQAKKDLLIGLLIFTLVITLFYYLWWNNLALTITFLVISVFVLWKWTNREEKFVYFVGFLLGPIIDLTLVPTGVWSYGNPTIFRVPIWLPLTYGILTVTAIKIGKVTAKLFQ